MEFIKANLWVFVILALWDLFWKGKALWKAAKNNDLYWFIFLLIVNSAGIVPAIYLKFYAKKK